MRAWAGLVKESSESCCEDDATWPMRGRPHEIPHPRPSQLHGHRRARAPEVHGGKSVSLGSPLLTRKDNFHGCLKVLLACFLVHPGLPLCVLSFGCNYECLFCLNSCKACDCLTRPICTCRVRECLGAWCLVCVELPRNPISRDIQCSPY